MESKRQVIENYCALYMTEPTQTESTLCMQLLEITVMIMYTVTGMIMYTVTVMIMYTVTVMIMYTVTVSIPTHVSPIVTVT